jgi:hypothetical protein
MKAAATCAWSFREPRFQRAYGFGSALHTLLRPAEAAVLLCACNPANREIGVPGKGGRRNGVAREAGVSHLRRSASYCSRTQRLRAGLTCAAPPALWGVRRRGEKPALKAATTCARSFREPRFQRAYGFGSALHTLLRPAEAAVLLCACNPANREIGVPRKGGRRNGVAREAGAAPPALCLVLLTHPALARWANL